MTSKHDDGEGCGLICEHMHAKPTNPQPSSSIDRPSPSPMEKKCGVAWAEDGGDLDGAMTVCQNARPCPDHDAAPDAASEKCSTCGKDHRDAFPGLTCSSPAPQPTDESPAQAPTGGSIAEKYGAWKVAFLKAKGHAPYDGCDGLCDAWIDQEAFEAGYDAGRSDGWNARDQIAKQESFPRDTQAAGWGDARLPELTAQFGHALNDDCEYTSNCVVGALQNASARIAELEQSLASEKALRIMAESEIDALKLAVMDAQTEADMQAHYAKDLKADLAKKDEEIAEAVDRWERDHRRASASYAILESDLAKELQRNAELTAQIATAMERWKFVPDDNGGHMLSAETGNKWYPESFTLTKIAELKAENERMRGEG